MGSGIEPSIFYRILTESGVEFFTGVPDSLLKGICHFINDNVNECNHIIAANEGNALALGIGHHLGTGKVPLVYMQNSGLGNVVNPLLSLADPDVYSVPAVLMIGWRGEAGVKDEPQHKKQGRVTPALLDAIEVPYDILDDALSEEEVADTVRNCIESCRSTDSVRALLVRKGFFAQYKPRCALKEAPYTMKREEAIRIVVNALGQDATIVSTTGLTSRELFEYRKETGFGHANDFLTVGGMGHANQIALGVALSQPQRSVVCLDGDGALLMHMGAMGLIGSRRPRNLLHVLLNNGSHDSVGGQSTVAFGMEFSEIARNSGYQTVFLAEGEQELEEIMIAAQAADGPVFLEIRVGKGWRNDIGRPTVAPVDNKVEYMRRLLA